MNFGFTRPQYLKCPHGSDVWRRNERRGALGSHEKIRTLKYFKYYMTFSKSTQLKKGDGDTPRRKGITPLRYLASKYKTGLHVSVGKIRQPPIAFCFSSFFHQRLSFSCSSEIWVLFRLVQEFEQRWVELLLGVVVEEGDVPLAFAPARTRSCNKKDPIWEYSTLEDCTPHT
jgi:hypothetical protein